LPGCWNWPLAYMQWDLASSYTVDDKIFAECLPKLRAERSSSLSSRIR
jgi:hypothetical protein